MWERHGERGPEKILSPRAQRFLQAPTRAAFAKRFAAKEAFAKALGSGVRAPATLPAIGVGHDDLGKPVFHFDDDLASLLAGKNWSPTFSISDEADYAVAYVILETP